MKKRTSLFVIAAIIVSLLIASRFAMVLSLPANDNAALSSSDSLNILSEFPAEISYVERKYDLHIETLDKETLSLLRQEAISNLSDPDYKFADLMDKISVAATLFVLWAREPKAIDLYDLDSTPVSELNIEYGSFL